MRDAVQARPRQTGLCLLRFITTDSQILGIVGWVGTGVGIVSPAVTVAGFWIAWVQLKRVKRSAEAAQAAVTQMTKVVRDREQSAQLTVALSHLRIASVHLEANPGAAAAYIDTSCGALSDAKVLARSPGDRDQLSDHLAKLRRAEEHLLPLRRGIVADDRTKALRIELREAMAEIETMIASLRYNFEQISVLT